MAKKLGYGGLANTNGARDFSGKTEAAPVADSTTGLWQFTSWHLMKINIDHRMRITGL